MLCLFDFFTYFFFFVFCSMYDVRVLSRRIAVFASFGMWKLYGNMEHLMTASETHSHIDMYMHRVI